MGIEVYSHKGAKAEDFPTIRKETVCNPYELFNAVSDLSLSLSLSFSNASTLSHSLSNDLSVLSLPPLPSCLLLFLTQITQLKIDHNPFAKGFRDNYDA